MQIIRKATIVVATICLLALAVFALVKSPTPMAGDVIIIKGGSLEVICPKGDACLGVADSKGQYKHKTTTSHITQIVVKDKAGTVLHTSTFDGTDQPQIEITYK